MNTKKKPEIEQRGNVFCIKFDNETDMEAVNEIMDEIHKAMNNEIVRIAEKYGISEHDASSIMYLRSRSRWTQEKEDYLIDLAKCGKPLPNVFSGEF